MATLDEKQAAVLQETFRLVGFHSDDYQFLSQTEASLWTAYETTIRQKKGAGAENIINQIKNNPDPLDRVVSLIDVIRTLDLDAAGNMAMDNLQENVRLLDEKRDKERLAREAEAVKKVGVENYQKHLDLLKRISQKIPSLEESIPDIAPSLIFEPIGTIEKLSALVTPETLATLVSEISHPVVENIYLQTIQILPQPAAAAAITVLKIATPQATVPQIQQLLDRLTLASEAIGKPLNIPQTAAANLSKIQAPPPATPPLTLSLHNQFLRAGYPAPQAQTLASQFATQFVPLINTIASFTPHQLSDSPQQHSQRVSQVQVYFSNQVIEYLSLRTVYFTRPAQFYSFQDNYSPSSHLTPNQSGWLNYIASSAKNKVLGKAQDVVWERFAASEVGKKVLTSLGTKAATEAAAVGAEAALVGAEVAAGPPGWVLAALTVLATFGKDILSWAQKNIKKYLPAIALGLTGIIGGVVAGLGLVGASALGLTGAVAGTAIQGAGGIAKVASNAGNAFTSATTAAVGLVATEIAAPIIIIIISIPIGIALILFIINSSALVVPPNNLTASGSGIIGGGGTCTIPSSGFCSPSYLSPTFGTQTNNAAQICNRESIGGNPAALNDSCLDFCDSGGDTSMITASTNPNVKIQKCTWINRHTGDYSAGLFQTNLLCSSHFEPSSGGAPKECYKAFAVNYCGSLSCPSVSDWTLLANCVAYFWNPDNSISYSNNQSSCNDTNPDTRNWGPWTTAKSCGIQSNCAP